MTRYSRLLEQSAASPATFSWLLLYASTTLLTIASIPLPQKVSHYLQPGGFLGTSLSSTLVYIWSRRNPETRLSFLGLLVFTAPYLPWVLIGFSLFMHGQVPKDEVLGIIVGHVYYFLADVWPGLGESNARIMEPPDWWMRLWEGRGRRQTDARGVEGDVAAAAARPGDVR
jgi:Derlin-2/3